MGTDPTERREEAVEEALLLAEIDNVLARLDIEITKARNSMNLLLLRYGPHASRSPPDQWRSARSAVCGHFPKLEDWFCT